MDTVKFPMHKASMTITHNPHKDSYQSAQDWIIENESDIEHLYEWISDEERQLAIDTDSIWTIQVYPNTPIGFYAYAASTFETLLAYVNNHAK